MAQRLSPWLHLLPLKMTKPEKDAKKAAVMAAGAVAMVAAASEARGQQEKFAPRVKQGAVVKAVLKAEKVKSDPHALSVPNAASAPTVNARPVKGAVMADRAHASTTSPRASALTA